MRVLLINGSPNEHGCTETALREVEKPLLEAGLETEFFWLGSNPISGCKACGGCQDGRCVIEDVVNAALERAKLADAYIFGSPVHYAAASGSITSFLDRFFYAAGKMHRYKPGAAVVSCRRGGSTAALDQLNKYFTISQMPIVSSQYWNMVHGNTPDEVRADAEGMQIMRTLGRNMAWLLQCIDAGHRAGIEPISPETRITTNFIR